MFSNICILAPVTCLRSPVGDSGLPKLSLLNLFNVFCVALLPLELRARHPKAGRERVDARSPCGRQRPHGRGPMVGRRGSQPWCPRSGDIPHEPPPRQKQRDACEGMYFVTSKSTSAHFCEFCHMMSTNCMQPRRQWQF